MLERVWRKGAPAAGHAGRCSPPALRDAVAAQGPHREPRGTPGNGVHKDLRAAAMISRAAPRERESRAISWTTAQNGL